MANKGKNKNILGVLLLVMTIVLLAIAMAVWAKWYKVEKKVTIPVGSTSAYEKMKGDFEIARIYVDMTDAESTGTFRIYDYAPGGKGEKWLEKTSIAPGGVTTFTGTDVSNLPVAGFWDIEVEVMATQDVSFDVPVTIIGKDH